MSCSRAFFCFVAIDTKGVPVVVPELIIESLNDKKNYSIGQEIRKRQKLEEKRFQIELKENL